MCIDRGKLSAVSSQPSAASAAGARAGTDWLQRLARIDIREPIVAVRDVTLDDAEELLLEGGGDRAARAGSDLDLVDRADRRDLDGRADEERLVADVEQLAGEHLLADLVTKFARNRDHAVPRNAREDRRGERRCIDAALADDEQVLAAALTQ